MFKYSDTGLLGWQDFHMFFSTCLHGVELSNLTSMNTGFPLKLELRVKIILLSVCSRQYLGHFYAKV